MHASQVYRKYLMWGLYALLFLAVLLIQEIPLGRQRFFGAKLNLMPMTVVLITMHLGHEVGGLFGLLAGCFWCMSGADDGSAAILTWTVLSIAAGYLCDVMFPRRFLPALALSLAALLFHGGIVFLLNVLLTGAPWSLCLQTLISAGLSLLACPVLYFLCRAIGKVVG